MWRDYIEKLKAEWIGKRVEFAGQVYTIVKVDYNGILHIDKKTKWNDTCAVYQPFEARKHLVQE